MEVMKVVKLIDKYGTCPECGNKYIGNGSGELEVDEQVFRRSCKCGWEVKVEEAK